MEVECREWQRFRKSWAEGYLVWSCEAVVRASGFGRRCEGSVGRCIDYLLVATSYLLFGMLYNTCIGEVR